MLTIDDIRKSGNRSGFAQVRSASAGPNGGGQTCLWKSYHYATNWRGPYRRLPEEAAQDYCDYVNGNAVQASATLATVDKSARPQKRQRTISDRERRLRKELKLEQDRNPPARMHEPICYLVGIKGDVYAVKIGYADYNVYSRLDSLQTGNPRELILLATLPGGMETERKLHAKFQNLNILQEWFRPSRELLLAFGMSCREYNRKVH